MANLTLFEKLDNIESRYEELTQQLSSPEVHNDSARFQKLAKTHADMAEMVAKYREWKEIQKGLQGAKQLLVETDDAEMKQMAHDEEHELETRSVTVERELKFLLLPRDPNDDKNVIVEIRAGTGGDEASLFAAELFRMYSRYAESQNWKVEILESSASSIGGMKEIVAAIQGNKVLSLIHISEALKDQFPNMVIFGPVHYGFQGIYNWQGELSATPSGANWFPDKYLAALNIASASYGKPLVDVYDFHWYVEEYDANGNRAIDLSGTTLTDAQVQLIVQSPRALWDPTFTDSINSNCLLYTSRCV